MLTELPIWQTLQQHRASLAEFCLTHAFQCDPLRGQQFSATVEPLYVDFSKNLITPYTLQLLLNLATACGVKEKIQDLFAANVVNYQTQQHSTHIQARRIEIAYNLPQSLDKMASMSEKIRSQQWLGYSGKPLTDVIHLGTGGSYLGPYLASQALHAYTDSTIKLHFFANQQDKILQRLLQRLNPETTLLIVSSKSFTTKETLHNFALVLAWLSRLTDRTAALRQCIAITANPHKAHALDIPEENILTFMPTIGGRYSIWSSIAFSLCISNGFTCFQEFLAGGAAMDNHFLQTPLAHNIPVILALIDIWYINFFSAKNFAVLAYHQDLAILPRYLQQLSMESLGKSVTQQGYAVDYQTGSVLWGGVGTTGQHAYHQLLHQGTEFVKCEFIVTHEDAYLFTECLAQARSLMLGQQNDHPAKNCPGNRPSTIIVLPKLTAYNLGLLLALYEHRIFVQASIWNINPFDQWGVEIGKNLGQDLHEIVKYQRLPQNYDNSTNILLAAYYQAKQTKN